MVTVNSHFRQRLPLDACARFFCVLCEVGVRLLAAVTVQLLFLAATMCKAHSDDASAEDQEGRL